MQIVFFGPVETICINGQSLFSMKNKKDIISLSSAEFAQIVANVNPSHAE